MNKCLVTTLKAHTNNEALIKYNVLTIKTTAAVSPTLDSQYFCVSTSNNGGALINSSNITLYKYALSGEYHSLPVTIPALSNFYGYCENKEGIIEVIGKYNLIELVSRKGIVRPKELYGIPGTIVNLEVKGFEDKEIDATKIDSIIDHSKFKTFICYDEDVNVVNKLDNNAIGKYSAIEYITNALVSLFDSLGIDDLVNNISLKRISFYSNRLRPGHLSSFAKLTMIEKIQFADDKSNIGDIMDFINPWIQAGRTSGKIEVHWLLGQTNITLNGQRITYPSGVDNSKAYLNWTSDGTVTFTAS